MLVNCRYTFSMLLTLKVVPFILRVIRPCLNPITMLQIVLPIPFILGSVLVGIHAFSICLVERPLALVDVLVGVLKSSLSVGFVVLPEAFYIYFI